MFIIEIIAGNVWVRKVCFSSRWKLEFLFLVRKYSNPLAAGG